MIWGAQIGVRVPLRFNKTAVTALVAMWCTWAIPFCQVTQQLYTCYRRGQIAVSVVCLAAVHNGFL